jgi:hypothetical protein
VIPTLVDVLLILVNHHHQTTKEKECYFDAINAEYPDRTLGRCRLLVVLMIEFGASPLDHGGK